MFDQNFLSPQVKGCTIVTDRQGIYDLPDDCQTTKDLEPWEVRKYQEHAQIPHNDSLVPSLPPNL